MIARIACSAAAESPVRTARAKSSSIEMAPDFGLVGIRWWCVRPARTIAATAHVVQSEDGRAVVIAFRGTEPVNLVTWFTDVDTAQQKVRLDEDAPIDIHPGFYRNVRGGPLPTARGPAARPRRPTGRR